MTDAVVTVLQDGTRYVELVAYSDRFLVSCFHDDGFYLVSEIEYANLQSAENAALKFLYTGDQNAI